MLFQCVGRNGSWILPEGLACAIGAKAKEPFAGRHKITRLLNLSLSGARESLRLFELEKLCGGEMPKHSRTQLKKKRIRE